MDVLVIFIVFFPLLLFVDIFPNAMLTYIKLFIKYTYTINGVIKKSMSN